MKKIKFFIMIFIGALFFYTADLTPYEYTIEGNYVLFSVRGSLLAGPDSHSNRKKIEKRLEERNNSGYSYFPKESYYVRAGLLLKASHLLVGRAFLEISLIGIAVYSGVFLWIKE